jgi:polar amino acid transport system substrate-binding protein
MLFAHERLRRYKGDVVSLLKIISALCLALLPALTPCLAAEIAIGFGDHLAPYVLPAAQSGIEVEIFREALAYRGHVLRPVFLPTRRLPQAFAAHEIDGAMSDSGMDLTGQGGIYGEPAVGFDNVLITRKDRHIGIARPGDLAGLSVLAFPDAVERFPDWLKPVQKAGRYFETNNQALQVRALQQKQYDVILSDRYIFAYFTSILEGHHVTIDDVDVHRCLTPNPSYYPSVFRNKEIRDDFNAGLDYLKKSGRYQEIYDRYVKRPS